MISLTDAELAIIMDCARPLAPRDRHQFLIDLASELGKFELLGEGIVARTCARLQRAYLMPRTSHNVGSKWGH
jgi:hypothetical protein